MSLINDALKKAQRERAHPADSTPTTTPPAPTPPPGRPAPARQELRSGGNPWLIILVIVGVIGGGTAVWFLKPGSEQPAVQTASSSPAPETMPNDMAPPAEPQPAPTTVAPAPEQEMPQLSIKLPGTDGAPTTAAATPVAVAPVPEPIPPPQQAVAAPANPAPLQITLQLEDPRILAFLDAAKINGIRAAADDAKLLMNNKVFRVGGVVDRELGLKLVQILPTELVFEDARGIQYRKIL